MRAVAILSVVLVCFIGAASVQAELRSTVLIRLPQADESVTIAQEKPVYFPGDTVRLSIIRDDSVGLVVVTPILIIEGRSLEPIGENTFAIVIPQNVTPGLYAVHLDVLNAQGRHVRYETNCIVDVEEIQDVEQIARFIQIIPYEGGIDLKKPLTLDREQIRKLQVVFHRDSIREGMGPQFVTIRTTVQLRRGTTAQTFERRVMTFRSHGDAVKDRAMFIQYRTAYGPYAAISTDEFERVEVDVDSLPNWALVKVSVETDYSIKIGAVDRSNAVTRYFRVKGPRIEPGFTIGVPKVLYDTRAEDKIEYGHSSAMVRIYYIDGATAHRFPINIGLGVFGVDSPIDLSEARGGFATSVSLDVIELMRRIHLDVGTKVNAGLELTPFFPIQRKSRLLFDAHIGLGL